MGKRTTLKSLCPKIVKENSFEGAPGGGSGALNYQSPYGTPGGGNYSQNPSKFSSSSSGIGKGPNHVGNDPTNQTGSAAIVTGYPTRTDRQSSSGAPIHPASMQDKSGYEDSSPKGGPSNPHVIPYESGGKLASAEHTPTDRTADVEHPNAPGTDLSEPSPGAKADQAKADTPLNPDQQFDGDVEKIFKKKQTPSPDEIMSALQYELGRMVKKDKTIAKRMVLKNMQNDPHYYSRLNMLNIDDDKMKVDESQVARTKAVLDQMISEKKKAVMPVPPHLDEIFQELKDRRFGSTKKEQS